MKQGTMNVQTENIFPIIKKFLYSEHEIFLRELVSNAVDACTKLRTLSSTGELKGETGELKVTVRIDKDAGQLIISDTGIGMTEEEVDRYINQIAFSGAREFVEKMNSGKEAGIIGHFGLGFYSSFMVSSKVEIRTKSWKEEPAVSWICDGSPDYTMDAVEKSERGTDIILYLNEDSSEFLEESRIREILNKYARFLPVDVYFGEEKINNTRPAWTRKPSELNDEDYKNFYRELYPMSFEEPMFHIHLNVDYPFNLTGILYFPRLTNRLEIQKNKIQLYCNQVFVTDTVEGIVPDFLTLLHGVIDSPDIPLNVSRSYLQGDQNVKKISSHITKKVADRLEEIFKNSREDFNSKWNDIKVFITYGMVTEEKFAERAMKFYLFTDSEGNSHTLEDYKTLIEPLQKDKDGKIVYLYAKNAQEQHSYIESAKARGYNVLIMDTPLDAHLMGMLEQKIENSRFVRVDSDAADRLIPKDDSTLSKLTDSQKDELKPVFESAVQAGRFTVSFESLREDDAPVIVTQNEFMRRMQEMSAIGGNSMFGSFPESYNLIVNSNHPVMAKLLTTDNSDDKDKLVRQAVDLALLSGNLLKGEELTRFIRRSADMLV
jgi:molecular chaperone HtpG